MTFDKSALFFRGTVAEGAVSISLNDSWTGKKLLEALNHIPTNNTNRLSSDDFDIKYQQKQQMERDQKKTELSSGRRTLHVLEINDSKNLTASLGAGKVRQMFDERRQRTVGIDKSYPLQPISGRQTSETITTNNSHNIKRLMVEQRRPAKSADPDLMNNNNGDIISNRLNGNYRSGTISNKLTDNNDYLDNEQFPESLLDDPDETDFLMGNLKIAPGRKPITSINNNNNNLKLKPLVTKTNSDSLTAKPLNGNRTLPNPLRKRTTMAQKLASVVPPKANQTAERATTPFKSPASSANSTKSNSSSKTSSSLTPSQSPSPKKSATDSAREKLTKSANSNDGNACKICGRRFNEDRLEKHESICKKTTTKKRKVFDVTKHRVKGTEAEAYLKKSIRSQAVKKTETSVGSSIKKGDWRRKHEEFIAAIRSAKQVQAHLAAGGKLSDLPPPPPSENPDYVQCPHCSRRFNESAAQRHIPKCATFQHNKPKPNAAKAALVKKR